MTPAAVGVIAFTLAEAGGNVAGGVFAWDRAGRWLAGATLLAAAVYEFTPLKDACLGRCRSPFGFLVRAWEDGPAGAVRMGAKHGAWCVGCCWALMASLFALGMMSVEWMAVVAALIAFEKLIRWRRLATGATATALAALAIVLVT
jgi:predicted metal-binding membrane protein